MKAHLLNECDGALHARGGLRGVDRGLPSVRSARGLQAVLEIVKRVQSRFHRGDRIQHHMQKEYIYWRKDTSFAECAVRELEIANA